MKKLFPAFVLFCIGLVVVGSLASRRGATSAKKPGPNEAAQAPIYAKAR